MSPQPRTLAVILARGGSKGLPGKNIIDLGGRPLLAYTVEAALDAASVHRVVVSTDSAEIADVAREHGADVPFMRPPDLAQDTSHSPDAVIHAVNTLAQLGDRYECVVMLQPTSPFRTGRHIDQGMIAFDTSDHDSLISIKKQDYPPWWMFKTVGDRLEAAVPWRERVNVFNLERQEFPPVYRPNGALYITTTDYLLRSGNLVNPNSCGFFEMGQEDSVDIDSKTDLFVAQAILQERKRA